MYSSRDQSTESRRLYLVGLIRRAINELALRSPTAFVPAKELENKTYDDLDNCFFPGFRADLGEGEKWYKLRRDLLIAMLQHLQGKSDEIPELALTYAPLCNCQRLLDKATSSPNEFDELGSAFELGGCVMRILEYTETQRVFAQALPLLNEFMDTKVTLDCARRTGGENSGILSKEEWALVVHERKSRCKHKHQSAIYVSEEIADELEMGTFPGIRRIVSPPPSPDTIRTKRE